LSGALARSGATSSNNQSGVAVVDQAGTKEGLTDAGALDRLIVGSTSLL